MKPKRGKAKVKEVAKEAAKEAKEAKEDKKEWQMHLNWAMLTSKLSFLVCTSN